MLTDLGGPWSELFLLSLNLVAKSLGLVFEALAYTFQGAFFLRQRQFMRGLLLLHGSDRFRSRRG